MGIHQPDSGHLGARLRAGLIDFRAAFRQFWWGYWQAPPSC
jgi:hypothetical protein